VRPLRSAGLIPPHRRARNREAHRDCQICRSETLNAFNDLRICYFSCDTKVSTFSGCWSENNI
jgi:hypothetical protein